MTEPRAETGGKRRRKQIAEAIVDGAYVPDHSETLVHRAARFFDWAAKDYPLEFVPWNYVMRAVQGFKRTPAMKSQEVETLRRRAGSIRSHLQAKYGRDFVSDPTSGARATVDDNDVAESCLPKNATRVNNAIKSMGRTHALIDVAKISNPRLRAWVKSPLKHIMTMITSPDFEAKLLPPPSPDHDED